jgi:hypothetical protein
VALADGDAIRIGSLLVTYRWCAAANTTDTATWAVDARRPKDSVS